ncbi:MAG: CDP-alcohol phosphatidyltransferase family protein [Promethearchaeota archaeon]|nr:MAG: CDP-alcohol phosphatidyltransferase family protein [Candidatus Lokiarchaeota archaeon]
MQLPEKRIHQKEILYKYNKYIDTPVKFLIKHHISPNKISLIGFIISLTVAFLIAIGGVYFSFWFAWIIPFLMGLAGAFDLFDGEVARRTHKETKAGAFLDSNLDRISDAIFVLGLIYGGLINYLFGYIIVFLVIMISYTRSRAENEGVIMKGIGFMERAERIIFLLVVLLFEMWFYFLTLLFLGSPITILIPFITRIPVTPIFLISIIIYTIALIITVAQRIIYTFITLKNQNPKNKKN